MTTTRIYHIRHDDTGDIRLVKAANAPRALAHIVKTSYTATVATQDQLVALLTAEHPIEIEDATSPAPTPEAA